VRFLGVDFGLSRTGLSLSDPLGVTCRPFGIVRERDQQLLVSRIVETADEQGVDTIVVGVPRPLSGGVNNQMAGTLALVEHLRRETGRAVVTWDERFTTRLAEQGRPRSEPLDAVAACYMLQSYLDAHLPDRTKDA